MHTREIRALEMQAGWRTWLQSKVGLIASGALNKDGTVKDENLLRLAKITLHSLSSGDTYYMNERFCELVDFARRTVPDELAFEEAWVQSPMGFMWLDKPFETPKPMDRDAVAPIPHDCRIAAVVWHKGIDGTIFNFCFDLTGLGIFGFYSWSRLTLHDGDKLGDKITGSENIHQQTTGLEGFYRRTPANDSLHEIRWLYTALHLMSQRVARTSEEKVSSLVRSMAKRKKLVFPLTIRVVALRRMEEQRPKNAKEAVDWKWQWMVHGHWRNQFYPSEQLNRMVWIESYVKGPEDKPIKPAVHTLYKAVR